jgi:hypothetical protein
MCRCTEAHICGDDIKRIHVHLGIILGPLAQPLSTGQYGHFCDLFGRNEVT